eukprot:6492144-Amphidinium_carterae.1
MAAPEEIRHDAIVSLVCVNERFWLCNAGTGERTQLEEGNWTLEFNEAGLGMLHQSLAGTDGIDYWCNDLLSLSAHEVRTGDGVSRILIQPREGASFWRSTIMSESRLVRLSVPLSAPVLCLEMTVRSFRVPRASCMHFIELPRICTYLFGAYPPGFIRKRLQRWHDKCVHLGIGAGHVRRSFEGSAVAVQGRSIEGEAPVESEQCSSISVLALPLWLLALDSSPQEVTMPHKGTPASPAQMLCRGLFSTLLVDASWKCVLPLRAAVLEFRGQQTSLQP